MTKAELESALNELPAGIRFAFAPLIKRAVGLAVGGTFGVWIFVFTVYHKLLSPELDVRENVLFVHDGKYITSAGGAKSFEAALYLCEHPVNR